MNSKTDKLVGERVTMIRNHLGMNQKSFAKEIGISTTALSDIEKNKWKPGFDTLVNIKKKFNVEFNFVMLGQGPMFSNGNKEVQFDKEIFNDPNVRRFLYYFSSSDFVRFYILSQFAKLYNIEKEYIEKVLEAEKQDEATPQD